MQKENTLIDLLKSIRRTNNLGSCDNLLYTLLEQYREPDGSTSQTIMRLQDEKGEGIIVCLSPLDTLIASSLNVEKNPCCPFFLEGMDIGPYLRDNKGWISFQVVYGFGAHNNRLSLTPQNTLIPLNEILHANFEIGLPEYPVLSLDQRLREWIDSIHQKLDICDYAQHALEQAHMLSAELHPLMNKAMSVVRNANYKQSTVTQCAVFDPLEQHWKFIDLDLIPQAQKIKTH